MRVVPERNEHNKRKGENLIFSTTHVSRRSVVVVLSHRFLLDRPSIIYNFFATSLIGSAASINNKYLTKTTGNVSLKQESIGGRRNNASKLGDCASKRVKSAKQDV